MTVLTFPSNPTEGQIYDAPNGIQYVYDGVKWAGETTTSSSVAVTGATQDRVAPMFVDGNNNGITFTYDDVTNTMTATVTSTVGDTLSNNSHAFTLESDGTLTLDGEPFAIPDVSNFITSEDIPAIPTNTNQLVNGAGFITLSDVPAGFSGSYDDLTNKPTIPTDVNDLTDTDGLLGGGAIPGAIAQGAYELSINTLGNVSYPGDITQSYQDNTTCLAGTDTVIYTGVATDQMAIKLFVMVEGLEDGGSSPETQACDIIAVRGQTNNIIHVTAYGVTYSGAAGMATFDGRLNVTSGLIEITCRPVSATNSVTASVHAISLTSNAI